MTTTASQNNKALLNSPSLTFRLDKTLDNMRLLLLAALGFALSHGQLTSTGHQVFVLKGDFHLYTCEGTSSTVPTDIKWFLQLQDGNTVPVNSSDIGQERLATSPTVSRRSFIRINSVDVTGLFCKDSQDQATPPSVFSLTVEDFNPIDLFIEPGCDGGRQVVLKEWEGSFKSSYWLPHYVTNKEIIIDKAIQGLKLTCLSSTPVKWIIHTTLTDFQYWTRKPGGDNPCHTAELILNPVLPNANQRFICGSDKDDVDTWVSLNLHTRNIPPDQFNKTQECVEQLGGVVFGSQTLGWTTAGGGVMSIVMMAGMVFLKRQLSQARNAN